VDGNLIIQDIEGYLNDLRFRFEGVREIGREGVDPDVDVAADVNKVKDRLMRVRRVEGPDADVDVVIVDVDKVDGNRKSQLEETVELDNKQRDVEKKEPFDASHVDVYENPPQ
jgi:hypothetical protein